MILSLFRKNTATKPVYAVYNAIVAQSRLPRLYAEWGVPDTVTGRFDMISLHMSLLFRRLRSKEGVQHEFAQAVFDLFFKDMDRSLREMGAGDLGVPKRIQKMGKIFFGLLAVINEALDNNDVEALEAVLRRNIYDDEGAEHARELARYVIAEYDGLSKQPVEAIIAGNIELGLAA
jgi:cytochrome b pre-mRNA-processing protein 3